jgi:uncharacterized membrane protein YjfL (UPF0719 family)
LNLDFPLTRYSFAQFPMTYTKEPSAGHLKGFRSLIRQSLLLADTIIDLLPLASVVSVVFAVRFVFVELVVRDLPFS